MTPLVLLIVASTAFVGSHFLLSHPLRAAFVTSLGERGFAGLYTIVALATFGWMIYAYGPASAATPQPLWDAGEIGWIAATLLMWAGAVLFMGSLRRNPAFPRPGKSIERIDEPRGVFAITRHAMMWGFAIWAIVHAIVHPTPASLILSAAIAVLALVGAALQDAKKEKQLGEQWKDWESRTSFAPFGRGFALPDGFAFIVGTIIFLAAAYAHGAFGYQSAGPWHWFA